MSPSPTRAQAARAEIAAGVVTTTRAGPPPSFHSRLYRMPRWLRVALTGTAFGFFFVGTSLIGILGGL